MHSSFNVFSAITASKLTQTLSLTSLNFSTTLLLRLGIFFGHHKGDIQENVISNMMRRTSPLNLSGMNEIGTVENVSIYRPLLPHTKDDIFDFAHTFGVPYFKDTTPKWSVRGKLR